VRRHSARFEMFAVRDGFVQLLADGEAEETDVTWGAPYYTINSLLELQRNHSVWMQLGDFLKHSKRMKRDSSASRGVDEVTRAIRERAASDPRYADLMRGSTSLRDHGSGANPLVGPHRDPPPCRPCWRSLP